MMLLFNTLQRGNCVRVATSFETQNMLVTQPRPQGFSVKKWVGRAFSRPTHFFKGKALGTRLASDPEIVGH